ncbi:MAG: CHRD domain-containing protein [Pirellulaceae bacterium]
MSIRNVGGACLACFLFVGVGSMSVEGAIVPFLLEGRSGAGLLGGNENPGVSGGGSGGLVGSGIFLDDQTNELTINVGWGSNNGFTDLTGNATLMHIHNAGSNDFTQNGGVEVNLGSQAGFDADFSSGGFSGTVTLTSAQATEILAGQYYINVHTAANGGGEIRGNFTAVPEPSSFLLSGLAASGMVWRRRRRA